MPLIQPHNPCNNAPLSRRDVPIYAMLQDYPYYFQMDPEENESEIDDTVVPVEVEDPGGLKRRDSREIRGY